jgi:hypothetical protein
MRQGIARYLDVYWLFVVKFDLLLVVVVMNANLNSHNTFTSLRNALYLAQNTT